MRHREIDENFDNSSPQYIVDLTCNLIGPFEKIRKLVHNSLAPYMNPITLTEDAPRETSFFVWTPIRITLNVLFCSLFFSDVIAYTCTKI